MAIYRTGQASMDANGYITGYGTKWKTALTLIRPGATIVFASNPVAYATISEIVSDTSLRAISSGGVVVPKGDYVILLHDSLTVDGLAQDVAETLRYYQGKETMYEHFVEFLKDFDWQRMEQLGEKAYAGAKAAEASANAAKASETNANSSKNAAAGSATTASQKATEAANSAGAAKTSETNANASKTAAANSAAAAASSATTAGQHKDAAAASASAARTSEGNASSSKNAAAASASAAKTSEANAKASEASATASKSAASGSATTASQKATEAAISAVAAKTSETNAKTSEINAEKWAKSVNPANLAQLDSENTFQRKQTFNTGVTVKASYVDSLLLESTNPTIKFRETDRADAPDYSFVFDGGGFRIQREDSGQHLLSYNKDSNTINIIRGDFTDKSGTRRSLQLSEDDYVSFNGLSLKNQLIMSNNGQPISPTILTRVFDDSGSNLLGSAELRANSNGNVELVNRVSGSPKALALFPDGSVAFASFNGRFISQGMGLGVGRDISTGYVINAMKDVINNGGTQAFRVTGSEGMVIGGTNFQYAPSISFHSGDVIGALWVDHRTGNAMTTSGTRKSILGDTAPKQNVLWGTANTTVDANGFVKRASPIVKIMSDSFETNEESEGVSVTRVGVGEYLVSGCLGLHSDLAWGGVDGGFEVPKDRNGQNKIWVDYDVNEDGSILVKTYHREYKEAPEFARNKKDGFEDGQPIDIPYDSFLSIRVEMPGDSIYNKRMREAESEVRSNANREWWSKIHETGCEEE